VKVYPSDKLEYLYQHLRSSNRSKSRK